MKKLIQKKIPNRLNIFKKYEYIDTLRKQIKKKQQYHLKILSSSAPSEIQKVIDASPVKYLYLKINFSNYLPPKMMILNKEYVLHISKDFYQWCVDNDLQQIREKKLNDLGI